jgi:hypothetical protein
MSFLWQMEYTSLAAVDVTRIVPHSELPSSLLLSVPKSVTRVPAGGCVLQDSAGPPPLHSGAPCYCASPTVPLPTLCVCAHIHLITCRSVWWSVSLSLTAATARPSVLPCVCLSITWIGQFLTVSIDWSYSQKKKKLQGLSPLAN